MQASFNFKPSQKSECGLETRAEMPQATSVPDLLKFGVQFHPYLEAERLVNKIP